MELLELILQKAGLQYISDLSNGAKKESVRRAVKEIPYDQYDLEEWRETIYYLTGGTVELNTQEEIINYIDNI